MRSGHGKGLLRMMAMVCAAVVIGCGTPSVKDSDTVLEIAGQPVVKAEYQMVLRSHVAEVKSKYSTEEANAEDFWGMEGEEGTPLEQVMELAKEDLTHKKVVVRLAEKAGIEGNADYLSIMEEAGAENTERKGKSASGEVIYGLTSFTPEDYYSYVYTKLEAQLMEELKSSHPISDDELEKNYQENQAQYTSEIRVHMLVGELQSEQIEPGEMQSGHGEAGELQSEQIEPGEAQSGHGEAGELQSEQIEPGEAQSGYGEAGELQSEQIESGEVQSGYGEAGELQPGKGQLESGMETAQQVKAAMEKKTGIDALREQYPQVNFYEIEMSSLNTEEGKSGAYAQRWLIASAMGQGQVCEPFFIGRNLMVMRCLARDENVAEPFEEIKGILKSEMQTQMAQEDIEKGIQEAEITFQEKVLKHAAQEALADK